jgi:hypothetical protein
MQFLASVFTGVALSAGSFFGFLHGGPVGTTTHPGTPPPVASSTITKWHQPEPVVVSATTTACVGAAVSTREQTLDAAEVNLTSALNSAYSARASALVSAYALTTGGGAVSAAVKAAWQGFSSSTKSADKTWRTARAGAWQAFMTAAKACKAPASILDTNDSALEVSGQ